MTFETCTTWLRSRLAAAVAAAEAHWHCHCAIKELSALNDDLIADVGLRRHEIGVHCRSLYLRRTMPMGSGSTHPIPPTTSIGSDIWCAVLLLGPH